MYTEEQTNTQQRRVYLILETEIWANFIPFKVFNRWGKSWNLLPQITPTIIFNKELQNLSLIRYILPSFRGGKLKRTAAKRRWICSIKKLSSICRSWTSHLTWICSILYTKPHFAWASLLPIASCSSQMDRNWTLLNGLANKILYLSAEYCQE